VNHSLTEPRPVVVARNGETVAEAAQTAERYYEKWAHCHVNWTAIFVGALAAFATVLLFGLVGVAVGAQLIGPEHRLVDLKKFGIEALIFGVCGAFFSFVVGGWVAGKIAGILHSEPAMLHGAIVWLVTVPMVVAAASFGAGNLLGGWYSGLGNFQSSATAANSPFVQPERPGATASPEEMSAYRAQVAEYQRNIKQWNEETPKVTRNTALGAVTALLLGLVGCVVGGWMASGEPMNFSHYQTRKPVYHTS
jgi:hypothetical protein